jgi:hypothetical protein
MAYDDHELTWLFGQSLPKFIGRVSRREARISLYSTLYVSQVVLALHAKRVNGRFKKSAGPYPWAGVSVSANRVLAPGNCAKPSVLGSGVVVGRWPSDQKPGIM